MILIPTQFEQRTLQPLLRDAVQRPIQLCGFGPVAAAARTAQLIAKHQPSEILLIGIAGGYDGNLPIGSAIDFGSVSCYGIGCGSGQTFQSASQMGWKHFEDEQNSVGDTIEFYSASGRQLLTVVSSAASPADVALRKSMFPEMIAEDMEGFGVATACVLADIPLRIVRGISNEAGDRDKSNWQIAEALRSAAELALRLIEES